MTMLVKDSGERRMLLLVAAFPEIFDNAQSGRLQRVFYQLIYILDPLMALELLCCMCVSCTQCTSDAMH